MKRHSTSQVIRKMKIKTTIITYQDLPKMLKTDNIHFS